MGLLKEGTLHINATVGAINTSAGVKEAAHAANKLNSSEYLEKTFFAEHESTLHTQELPSGGKVSLHVPSAPYSEEAVMVIAAGPDSLKSQMDKTEFIYDLPFDTQVEYWRSIYEGLRTLDSLSDATDEDNEHTVIATENCMTSITSDRQRTSRSIRLPHAQLFRIDNKLIVPERQQIPHLRLEQKMLKENTFTANNLQNVHAELVGKHGDILEDQPAMREEAPYGYSFSFVQGVTPTEIAGFMADHHKEYTNAAKSAVELIDGKLKKRIIDQPSYRAYYFLDKESSLSAIISTEFFSHAGVMEAAGVSLKRGPDYPVINTEERLHFVRNHIADMIYDRPPAFDRAAD